jgi:Family of unknown function (DUF5683)
MNKYLFIICCFIIFSTEINAQTIDSIRIQKDSLKTPPSVKMAKMGKKDSVFLPIPRKALLYSIIPGGGQIYNRKLWYVRLPLVGGAMGGTIGYSIWATKKYKFYKSNYFKKANGITPLDAGIPSSVGADRLKGLRDSYYKRSQESYVFIGLAYILVAAEAFTTAHLMNFDISEDISFKVKPAFEGTPMGGVAGLGVKISF